MSNFTLRIRNFRNFDELCWSPEGVCVLSGANGAGKSTTLEVLLFLRTLLLQGPEVALSNLNLTPKNPTIPIEFSLEVEGAKWTLKFPVAPQGTYSEILSFNEDHRRDFQHKSRNIEDSFYLMTEEFSWAQPLKTFLKNLRVEFSVLGGVVRYPTPEILNGFEWFKEEAEKAFPGIWIGLSASKGVTLGLNILTAIAGAEEGSVLAFDSFENQLHPHAIRSIISAMRQRSEERNLTIILTTHSPVVFNAFKGSEDQVYVLEKGQPVPLDELHEESFLSHFSLGDLYEREQFSFPAKLTELHSEDWLAQAKPGSLYERLAFGSPEVDDDSSSSGT